MLIKKLKPKGFTIVELLIVIIVIAILATLVITAYNGIQQKAKNTQRIATVKEYIKILTIYAAQYGSYPITSNQWVCLGEGYTGSCFNDGTNDRAYENSTANTELKKISPNLPKPDMTQITLSGGVGWSVGAGFSNYSAMTVDGISKPNRIWFELKGRDQDCDVGNIIKPAPYNSASVSTTRNTAYSATSTDCIVSLPNPSDI